MSENPLNRLTHDQLKLKIEFKYGHEFFCKTMIKQVFLPILYIYKIMSMEGFYYEKCFQEAVLYLFTGNSFSALIFL